MKRSALVTGGTGFIGAHLIEALVREGWATRTCGRRPRPRWLPEEVDYRQADLAEGEGLDSLFEGVTHLFHLAGASSSLSSDEEMHRLNVVATEGLLAAALSADLDWVLYMSTTAVYGEKEQLPQPVVETAEPNPSRGYGKEKWQAEQVVWQYADKGLPATVVRPVTVYGPGNIKLLGSTILDAAIERYAGLKDFAVAAEPVELRLVHVDDVVSACLHLSQSEEAAGGAFNIASDMYPSSHEVAGIVGEELGLKLELSDDPECGLSYEDRKKTRDEMLSRGMEDKILLNEERVKFLGKSNRNNRLSIDALKSTGFSPRVTDLPDSIASTISWYLQNRWIL